MESTVTKTTASIEFSTGNALTITGARLDLYGLTDSAPVLLSSFDYSGQELQVLIDDSSYVWYSVVAKITAYQYNDTQQNTGDRDIRFLSVFNRDSEKIVLSEHSTIANTWCFCRFIKVVQDGQVVITACDATLRVAWMMKNNFIHTNGQLSGVIQQSPNGFETNSWSMFNSLANLTYYAIVDPDFYNNFLISTLGSCQSGSFNSGLLQMVLNPFNNATDIYNLVSNKPEVYSNSLKSMPLQPDQLPVPNQWTLTIKRNQTGAKNFLPAGVAYVVFDKNDRAWLANNVRQGSPESSSFCYVLEPDGSPCHFSPISGGGLLGVGFGVAIDNEKENIWFGNYGWGSIQSNPQEGSVSHFDLKGRPVSPPNGHVNGLSRVQGLNFDKDGNLWMASIGTESPLGPAGENIYPYEGQNSAVVVYLDADPNKCLVYEFDSQWHQTFDVVIDDDGYAYVSNIGSSDQQVPSSVYKLKIDDTKENIDFIAKWDVTTDPQHVKNDGYESFRQVQLTAGGEVLIGAVGTSRIIRLNRDLKYRGEFTNKIYSPWGITVDKNGVIYAASFFRFHDQENGGSGYGITVIKNEDDNTAQLMTLPSGGDEVMLANGFPLFGNVFKDGKDLGTMPSYSPLMRMTSTNIDRAGNLWAMNNWKPSLSIDWTQNPGGDGVVIFVGAAEPG